MADIFPNRRTRYKALWKKTRLIPQNDGFEEGIAYQPSTEDGLAVHLEAMTGRCMFCWHWRERRK